MRKLIVASLTAAAVLVGLAAPSRAGFFLRVPFVTVHVDPGVYVGAGPVQVQVPGRAVARRLPRHPSSPQTLSDWYELFGRSSSGWGRR